MSMSSDKARILLVDDQPARLLTYEAILGDLGHELVRAQSGTEALEQLMRQDFAAILLDVNMPGMDGFETAALIHQHPRFERTPIIFVTGVHLAEMDQLKAYELGAVDYVYVPVIPQILRGKVQVLVELYVKRRELERLNAELAAANAQLSQAHSELQAESMRELKRFNETLEHANAELEAANRTLQGEIAERRRIEEALQRADRRKDEFLAMLAHELRNPLSAINNGVRLLETRLRGDSQGTWAHQIIGRQVKHLTRLIDDLLDVSRITTGKIELRREPVDLSQILSNTIETLRPLVDARRHRLEVDVPPEPVWVEADVVRLTQIFDNLLTNAAKYTNEGGRIRVVVERTTTQDGGGGRAVVRVRDTGIGIAPEMLAGVFDLFAQADSSLARSEGGLGIGLALARGLAQLHGGSIEAASEGVGCGSEFTLWLPTHTEQAVPQALRQSGPLAVACSGKRLLVVDDNVDSAQALALWLESMGHTVRTEYSGEVVVDAVQAFQPEAVLLDIGLPGLSGYDVAKRLRAQADYESLLLIAMTGYGRSADRDEALKSGFDHHLVKPVDHDVLQALLQSRSAQSRLASGAH